MRLALFLLLAAGIGSAQIINRPSTGTTGGITGPSTTVVGVVPTWNATNGTALADGLTPTGNGTKVATSTGTLVIGDCVKIGSAFNYIDAGSACGSGGGGGASMATQLADFAPGTFTATTMQFGAITTSSISSKVTLGGTTYVYTNADTLTVTGTASDQIYYYIDPASGHRTFGYGSTNTYACDNCGVTPVSGISAYPAGVYKLYSCHITAGVPDANTTCSDDRPILGFTPLINGYGTALATNGGLTEVDSVSIPVYISASSYTITDANGGHTLIFTNAGTTTVTMPQAVLGNQFRQGWNINVTAAGGQVNFQPVNSQIGNGSTFASTYTLNAASGAEIVSDPTLGANGSYDVFSIASTAGAYLPSTGGTMTGALTVTSNGPQISVSGGSPSNFNDYRATNDIGTAFLFGLGGSALVTHTELQNKAFFFDNDTAYMTLDTSGNGIFSGSITTLSGLFKLGALTTPASSSAACTTGSIEADATYIYVCTATNQFKRVALATF